MKNGIKNTICMILMIVLLALTTNVYAANDSFKISLSADKTSVKRGESVTITIALSDIKIESGEKGIGAYSSKIDFDSSVFEENVTTSGTSKWERPTYENTGIISNTNDGEVIKTAQDVGSITFTVKENAPLGETTIKLTNFSGSAGKVDVTTSDVSIKITIADKNSGSQGGSGNQSGNENEGGSGSQGGNENEGGSGSQGGNENEGGSGSQSGNENEGGNGNQSGSGSQSGNENEGGNGNQSGSGSQSGNENEGGSESQSGNENQSGNTNQSGNGIQSGNTNTSGYGNTTGNGSTGGKNNNTTDLKSGTIPKAGASGSNIVLYILTTILVLAAVFFGIKIRLLNKRITKK